MIDLALSRTRAQARDDRGFTLLETVLAIGLLAIVITGLTGLMAAAFTAQGLSRQRTIAQQAAMDQIESVRRMAYSSIGTPNGNPAGTLTSQTITKAGFAGTATYKVKYVSDPAPTAYTTLADYKKVQVTITRSSDSRVLARNVTYVAPPGRANYGGVNNATVVAQVVDMGNNTPVQDVNVSLTSSTPSVSLSDLTDGAGNVTFPALTANPDSSKYFTLALTAPTGYQALTDDLSPAAAAHHSLSPGETFTTALRIYKPATLNLAVTSGGVPYGGTSSVTVSSSRQTQVFNVIGSSYSVTSLNGESIIPGLQYTVVAKTTTPLCGNPAPKYVPDTYPTVMTSTITSPLVACPSGTLNVTVKRSNGSNVGAGATVTVTGGPNNISFTGLTLASSVATFTVPTGSGYTIKAWSCLLADASKSKTQTAVTIASGANNQTLTFNSSSCPAP